MSSPQSNKINERKAGLSCAECRRSKLKCDRNFPCQSCVRRGCAKLCPYGMLAASKGNTVLIAHAQQLTTQVKSMSARIQELEKALQEVSSTPGATSHPWPPQTISLEMDWSWQSGALESLSMGVEGRTSYCGGSTGSERMPTPSRGKDRLCLPAEVIELVNSFPFGPTDCLATKDVFLSFVPPRERALQLMELYYRNVAWMHDPIVINDFVKNVMDPIYSGTIGSANLHVVDPHRLSVFFALLATALLHDDNCTSAHVLAEHYYALSRAALALDSVLVNATSFALQALFMMFQYLNLCDQSSNETSWLLSGLCCRLAHTIGIGRDNAGWDLDPEETQRRRVIFWELFTYDTWTSLVTSRPPALNIQYSEYPFPEDHGRATTSAENAGFQWSYRAWKFRYSAACLSISVHLAVGTSIPLYSEVLALDDQIRKYPVPSHLQLPTDTDQILWSADPFRAMEQYSVVCVKETNLLYLHKSYFARVLQDQLPDPLEHQYAPSVLAVHQSACKLLAALRSLYAVHQKLTSRIWFFWSGIFSSCMTLGVLVLENPGCAMALNVLQELQHAIPFYAEGSKSCRPPGQLATLEKLYQRACSAYAAFRATSDDPDGYQAGIRDPSDASSPSSVSVSSHGSHQSFGISGEDSMGHMPTIEAFTPSLGYDAYAFLACQGYVNPEASECPAQPRAGVVQPHPSVMPWAHVGGNPEQGDVQYVPPICYQADPAFLEDIGGGERRQALQGIWIDRIHG